MSKNYYRFFDENDNPTPLYVELRKVISTVESMFTMMGATLETKMKLAFIRKLITEQEYTAFVDYMDQYHPSINGD